MASRRNRIIYASQSVQAEGRILYRVQTLGSTSTFETTDVFELGQLNFTDVVDSAPLVNVTLETNDYGSIYTMATLAKVPVENLHHNIRQSDGVTFFGPDVSEGVVSDLIPVASGTGVANIVAKDEDSNEVLAYLHGVQLIDYGRECGISKGLHIWSPIQDECALGTTRDDIEFTKLLRDVYINNIEWTYDSENPSIENYTGETEQKQWLLNAARFLSWEEWHIGYLSGQTEPAVMADKEHLQMSLPLGETVPTLTDRTIAFLYKDSVGRSAITFNFARGGGLEISESKMVPVFSGLDCVPSNVLEYFIYEAAENRLYFYANGLPAKLEDLLPAQRSEFIAGDKVVVFYAASDYAAEIGNANRPVGADSSHVLAKYFAPISTEDVEDVGAVRQGQVEIYLVDPDLLVRAALSGATITDNEITFSDVLPSSVDLTNYIGLRLRVIAGPGKEGPAREIIAATNNLVGAYNNGTVTLGGAEWPKIRLIESASEASTNIDVYVENLCGIDADYVGSDIEVVVSGVPESAEIAAVDVNDKKITLDAAVSDAVDNESVVLVSTEPTEDSTILIGDYEMALRIQSVTLTADLSREPQFELGHLNPYARTLNLPMEYTAAVNTTATDLLAYATFAGKGSKYEDGTLTDVDIIDLLAKDNLVLVAMVYQQTDQEAGGTGLDRKVLSADMFGDEYFVDGVRYTYNQTDGSLREYPLKTVIAQNLRITEEGTNTPITGNATQTFNFRGTNEITAVRGFINPILAVATLESQGE